MVNKGSDHDNQAACIYVLWRSQHYIWQKEQTMVLWCLVHAGEERQTVVESHVEKKFVSTVSSLLQVFSGI